MKIVKPVNVTDEILIDSSIPIPDTARGEQEWQGEEQRKFEIGPVSIPLILIDSVYVKDYGLYTLSGNKVNGYQLTRFNDNGDYIASVLVPKISDASGTDSANVSLSFDEVNNTLMVGRTVYSYGEVWDFDFVSVRLDFLAQVELRIDIDFGYKAYKAYSEFKSKTDGLKVVFLAVNKDDPYGDELSRELAIFSLKDMKKISSTNDTFSDFCISDGEIYCLAEEPSINFGQPVGNVTVFDDSFKIKRKIEFKWPYSDQLFGAKINGANSLVTYSIENRDQLTLAQIYDKNMINIGSYKLNDEVIKSSTKRKYRCAVDATFDDPELGINLSPPAWVDVGAVNRWMPFDRQPSQQAVSDNPMYYKLKPGEFVRALSIFNISSVSNVNVKVIDPVDGVIYDRDFYLVDNSNVIDMWTYLTLPVSFKKELIITDLVCFRESEIEITLTGENPAVGAIVVGNESPAGRCVNGTGVRSNQFSIRKENGFGGFDIIQRGVGKIARFRIAYDISQIDYITNLLESIDSQYCVFIGELPDNKVISIYGVLDPYQTDFETPKINTLEFDVLGVL